MSGGSRESYASYSVDYSAYRSADTSSRRKSMHDRSERVRKLRDEEEMNRRAKEREKQQEEKARRRVDTSLIRNQITSPSSGVKRVHIFMVDNSSSNRVIAIHMRSACDYINEFMQIIDPGSQVAFLYFSDHCDGPRIRQDVDFFSPGAESAEMLYSTIAQVDGANGGDWPEAIECVAHDMCKLNFKDAIERHLYLVTDAVPHGMGFPGDDGCPEQRSWERTKQEIDRIFTSFVIVGCGKDSFTLDFQEKMLAPERVPFDLIDLSQIGNDQHRRGITLNALLFLVARTTGVQTAEMFLAMLYEKWLKEPIFGTKTDTEARRAITRFLKYLEIDSEERERMVERLFPED